jgi:hypothetical protein
MLDCCKINFSTSENIERVEEINVQAPDCACEKISMSKFSPGVIENSEELSRFVFSPVHVNKKGKVKPSLFSHVNNRGCSIQRNSIAKDDEIVEFLKNFLSSDNRFGWLGVLTGDCGKVRKIDNNNNQLICVYDSAEETNPAHGEMCQSNYIIEDADRLELRAELWKVFGELVSPEDYRGGAVLKDI